MFMFILDVINSGGCTSMDNIGWMRGKKIEYYIYLIAPTMTG